MEIYFPYTVIHNTETIIKCVHVDVLLHQPKLAVITWPQKPVQLLTSELLTIGANLIVSSEILFIQLVTHSLTTYIPYVYVIVMMEKLSKKNLQLLQNMKKKLTEQKQMKKRKKKKQYHHQLNQKTQLFVIMLLSTLNVIIQEMYQQFKTTKIAYLGFPNPSAYPQTLKSLFSTFANIMDRMLYSPKVSLVLTNLAQLNC